MTKNLPLSLQKWEHYLAYGPQSWEKIIEADWRRRVGLRFMYKVLQLDPQTYTDRVRTFAAHEYGFAPDTTYCTCQG